MELLVISEIYPQVCQNVTGNINKRVFNFETARGGLLPYLIVSINNSNFIEMNANPVSYSVSKNLAI